MATCPISALQAIEIIRLAQEQAKKLNAGSILLGFASTLLEPLLEEIINGAEALVDLEAQVEGIINDIVNAISPESWVLMGISYNAKMVYDAAAREIYLLNRIKSIIKGTTIPEQPNKYERLSKYTIMMLKEIEKMVSRAIDDTGKRKVTDIKNASAMTQSVMDMLTGKTSWAEKEIASIKKQLRQALTEEAKKQDTKMSLKAFENIDIKGITEPLLDYTQIVTLFNYMYSLINGIRDILKLYCGININMTQRFEQLGTGALQYLNTANLATEPKDVRDANIKEATDAMDDAWNKLKKTSLSGGIGVYRMTTGETKSVDDWKLKDALYMNVPAGELTVYGTNLKILSGIPAIKMLGGMLGQDKEDQATDQLNLSMLNDKMNVKLSKVRKEIAQDLANNTPHVFTDAFGKNQSALYVLRYKKSLLRILGTYSDEYATDINKSELKAKLREILDKLEAKTSEPALGVSILTGYVAAKLISPRYASKGEKDNRLMDIIGNRLTYLNELKTMIYPIISYRDENVESLLAQFDGLGLEQLQDALKSGAIVMGAVSIAGVLAGELGEYLDIIKICVKKITMASLPKDIKEKYIKAAHKFKAQIDSLKAYNIRNIVSLALSKIGFSISLLDSLIELKYQLNILQEDYNEFIETVQPALLLVSGE